MDAPAPITQQATLSDSLAAERTFLAWIRTGLALMGFGFVVARFGLYLEQLHLLTQRGSPVQSFGLSLWFGTALIAVGVVVYLLSAWHHLRLVRALERGERLPLSPSAQAIGIALFLALVGLAMAIYLVALHQTANVHSEDHPEVSMGLAAKLPQTNLSQATSSPAQSPSNGIITQPSHHSVDETVAKLQSILQAKGVTLFALVDHSGEAEKAGMRMPPTKLLIFGSPKAGTPLMLAAPSVAIDLPLKILVWEDGAGKVWISYNSSEYLKQRHNLPQELLANIAVVETLAARAAE